MEDAGFGPHVTVAHLHSAQRIAIIGGGWAGMAAGVALQTHGHEVHLWEASRTWGGRARALALQGPQGQTWLFDNGQHILIGAYEACLNIMQAVGVDITTALLRLPLDLRYADGTGLQLPNLPPPWDAAFGIAHARGWSWSEKLALLRLAHSWKRRKFQCAARATVADICGALPARLIQDFIEPLCISALNLPAQQASGRIFLRVLQDGLFSGKGGSNLLIPRTDLSSLFPASAAHWLQARGAKLHLGLRAPQLSYQTDQQRWMVGDDSFDAVIVATSSAEAARLAQAIADPAAHQWAETAKTLPHTAIATVYAYSPAYARQHQQLAAPMVALRSGPNAPAQFAFDKSQSNGASGCIALVVSASQGDKESLQSQAIAQARAQLGIHDLQALQTVIDKRATFACTPHVTRPRPQIAHGLWACGDYVDGPYPATLEGAVRSGLQVAAALCK